MSGLRRILAGKKGGASIKVLKVTYSKVVSNMTRYTYRVYLTAPDTTILLGYYLTKDDGTKVTSANARAVTLPEPEDGVYIYNFAISVNTLATIAVLTIGVDSDSLQDYTLDITEETA